VQKVLKPVLKHEQEVRDYEQIGKERILSDKVIKARVFVERVRRERRR
jgi:hypothetical protein